MITNKALFGLLGIGAIAAAWYFLPKDSKIRKAITGRAGKLADTLTENMSGMNQKMKTETVRNSNR